LDFLTHYVHDNYLQVKNTCKGDTMGAGTLQKDFWEMIAACQLNAFDAEVCTVMNGLPLTMQYCPSAGNRTI